MIQKQNGHNESEHEQKSNALIQYIGDVNKKGKKLVGGIVIKKKNSKKFYYYDRNIYKSFKEAPGLWKDFNDLFTTNNL